MALCPDIVADGKYTNFGEVLTKLVDTIALYNQCQIRHDGLVGYEKDKK